MPEAYVAKAWQSTSRLKWKEAEKFFQQSIELDPGYTFAYNGYGIMLDAQRRFVEAEKILKKAVELAPFNPVIYSRFCDHYYYDRNFQKAEQRCKAALQLEDNFVLAKKKMFWISVFQDERKAVAKLYSKTLARTSTKGPAG